MKSLKEIIDETENEQEALSEIVMQAVEDIMAMRDKISEALSPESARSFIISLATSSLTTEAQYLSSDELAYMLYFVNGNVIQVGNEDLEDCLEDRPTIN